MIAPGRESPSRNAVAFLSPKTVAAQAFPVRPMNTLLYIEDNLPNLRLVERILDRRPAIKLLTATRGERGIELAREHQPDLVLLDLQLPGMLGDEVLTRLRADSCTMGIPVLMVSSDATRAAMERLQALGAQGYVTKPFVVPEFLAILDEFFPDRAQARIPHPNFN